MTIYWPDFFSETDQRSVIEEIERRGHTVTDRFTEACDLIYCASIDRMRQAWDAKNKRPMTPLVVYCWDYYKWVHEGRNPVPRDWGSYRDLMYAADIVLTPSISQKKRLSELLGIKAKVVYTAINVKDMKTKNGKFILDPVRFYPEENEQWVVKACEELDIPCLHPEHGLTRSEFEEAVANCTFMTCGYREASTGGLTLIEGLWNGKPSLVSNSPYMGGKEYLGPFVNTFQYDDYEDLKVQLLEMWINTPEINVPKAREYIYKNFSAETMANKILSLCEPLINF